MVCPLGRLLSDAATAIASANSSSVGKVLAVPGDELLAGDDLHFRNPVRAVGCPCILRV